MAPQDQRSRRDETTSTGHTGEMAGQARERAGQVASQTQEKAGHVADQTRGMAGQVTEQAKEQATSQLENQKIRAASGIGEMADVIRQVSQTLREQEKGNIAGYADNAANQIERISGYMQQQDVSDMVAEVERFARRQPAMFLGGAFALGVLGARFLKASQPQGNGGTYDRYNDQYAGQRMNRQQPYGTPSAPRYAETPRRAAGYTDTPPSSTRPSNTDTSPDFPAGAEG